jgi:hypothetical protein
MTTRIRVSVLLVMLQFVTTSFADIDVAGVQIDSSAALSESTQLLLNGAGIRRKFFTDLYIGALYLPTLTHSADDILEVPPANRLYVRILHSKISRQKLIQAWTDGFERNHDATQLIPLQERITQFTDMFSTTVRGDEIFLDYTPSTGTRIRINDNVRGVIEGADFNRSLLSIWLGRRPTSSSLKNSLLGND